MTLALDATRYAGVNARVRGLFSRFIPDTLWTEILAVADLPGLLVLLRQSWYAEGLSEIQMDAIDPATLERVLWRHLASVAHQPVRMLQGASRELLEWFWRRLEVDNLKTVLRGVYYHVPPDQFQASLIPLVSASDLPWSTLTTAESVFGVADQLQNTVYGQFLARAMDRFRRDDLLFLLEVALDLGYHERLLKNMQQLHGRDRREAQRFIGTWLDAENLLWAYRYRTYAEFSPEEILNYTLHRGLKVNAEVVRAIALGAALPDVIHQVWGDALPGIESIEALPEREALPRLELILRRYLYALAKQTWQGYPLHLGTVLAYQIFIEAEMRDLMTTVEGIVFGWNAERIRPYLIGERG